MIVAGEASAEKYGARLVGSIRARRPSSDLCFYGTGGDEMQKAGVDLLCHIRDLASIGPREALSHMYKYVATYRALLRRSRQTPPAVSVLIDFPEFNLRLAGRLKRSGTRVIYYVGPQIWAWRRGRIRTVRRFVDKMAVILPFEEQFYREHGVEAEFVGHPLLEDFTFERDRSRFARDHGLDPGRRIISLLPGSRRQEVEYILPTLLRASLRVLEKIAAQFIISIAPGLQRSQLSRIAAQVLGTEAHPDFRLMETAARDMLACSDFAFVKSGTSTLEAALVGTPFLITYKISRLSWLAGNILVSSPHKGLVNLVAGRPIVPEILQDAATPEALSRTALEYLRNPEKAEAMRARLLGIRDLLGARTASESVASMVVANL